MPKEYINYPEPEQVAIALTEQEIQDGVEGIIDMPAAPQIALHWQANQDTPQLSFSMDADVLASIVATRGNETPDHALVAEPGRAVFYTATLGRSDLQRLIKAARRARDAAYGADE